MSVLKALNVKSGKFMQIYHFAVWIGWFTHKHTFFLLFYIHKVSVNEEIKNYNEFMPLLLSDRGISRWQNGIIFPGVWIVP